MSWITWLWRALLRLWSSPPSAPLGPLEASSVTSNESSPPTSPATTSDSKPSVPESPNSSEPPVHADVRDRWEAFNRPFEGRLHFMYLDIKGLVTTGVGNLIDPVAGALALPWKRADGTRATLNEIQEEWIAVKRLTKWAPMGGVIFGKVTKLRLTDEDVDRLVMHKLDEMAAHIQRAHPCFASLPSDVQLAVLSMAWAAGPAAHYPKFWACVEAGDYAGAATECTLHPEVGTIVARNAANRALLLGAAHVPGPVLPAP